MSLIAKEKTSPTFEPMPAGTYIARCYSIVELGTSSFEYMGEIKKSHKIRVGFEFPTETKVFKEGNGEQPFVLSKEYTLSLSEKANLRQDLQSWRGKSFTPEELQGFDLKNILDKTCTIGVSHTQKKDGSIRAEISSISKPMAGITCPDRINPLVYFEIDDFSQETFDSFPDWLKTRIMDSEEYQVRQAEMRDIFHDSI